jgi:putative PIN family toxin of toxin-antitoxin system
VRIVLDTNVLIAAIAADGLCRDLVRRRVRTHELCTSEALLKEFAATLRRKFGTNPADVPLLAEYRLRATLVKPAALPGSVCRDPDDDIVLATALAAHADVIVTGDADLLVLQEHAGIPILSPRQFVERLDGLK